MGAVTKIIKAVTGGIGTILGGGPDIPAPATPPPPVTPPESAPTKNDPAVKGAGEAERKRAALAQGRGSTILTGSRGITSDANTAKKTLLGQ